MRKIKKILIANRGEVASRIIKTCKKLLIETVAIFSPSDSKLSYISESDYAFSLDSNELFSSYLDQEKILKIALANNCDAIHAGYGFLSENYEFAKKCTDSGVIFIGPDELVLKICGDKNKSKELAKKIGINVIDSFEVDFSDDDKILKSAEEVGFPLLIKASFGGGGKGIKVVYDKKALLENIILAKNEAYNAFGKGELIIEKYLPNVKHIEVQILGDNYGNYIHLFERECSIQRRFQKIIEEAPSSLTDTVLEKLFTSALNLAKELNYNNAGTMEFLVEPNGDFYFIEVNPRLQVEHRVTENITNLDIVKMQIEIAEGKKLSLTQNKVFKSGHSIQCRVYAENPENGFFPDSGNILYHNFSNEFAEFDLNLTNDFTVTTNYDPMIAKIVSFSEDRETTILKLQKALSSFMIFGLNTNLSFLMNLIKTETFQSFMFNTTFVEENLESLIELDSSKLEYFICAVIVFSCLENKKLKSKFKNIQSGWRNIFFTPQFKMIEIKGAVFEVYYKIIESLKLEITFASKIYDIDVLKLENKTLTILINKVFYEFYVENINNKFYVHNKHLGITELSILSKFLESNKKYSNKDYVSPMPCEISNIHVKKSDKVLKGQKLITITSMKMEMTIFAMDDAVIEDIFISKGFFVKSNELLLRVI